MGTRIHISGLTYFCTDDELRQAFIPFGRVVLAHVLRDEWGHSLGFGVVHMARSEDVEQVFNRHQRLEVLGSRVDLWEPAETEDRRGDRIMASNVRDARAALTGQDTGHEKSQKALHPYALLMRRLIRTLASS